MVLTNRFNDFNEKFDLTEGIVSAIKWDANLMDLLVIVYYFWDDYKNTDLTIRFKNCREAKFTIPKVFNSIPKHELHSYAYSWYTITQCSTETSDGLIKVDIKTIDDNPSWLSLKCEEIWVEDGKE